MRFVISPIEKGMEPTIFWGLLNRPGAVLSALCIPALTPPRDGSAFISIHQDTYNKPDREPSNGK